jgi:hypothetical protein
MRAIEDRRMAIERAKDLRKIVDNEEPPRFKTLGRGAGRIGELAEVAGRYVAHLLASLAAIVLATAAPGAERSKISQGVAFSADLPTTSEIVSFGDGSGRTVTVIRGPSAVANAAIVAAAPSLPPPAPRGRRIETVTFANPELASVTVIRGAAAEGLNLGLFRSANGGEIDRVAFAVEGVESGHGTNLRMWRAEPGGPQGPMQVSAAAALDVGGGDRFDVEANRQLGRAFLVRMYERYGNWPDALAGYNWGPGNVDSWIAAGRPEAKLPLETARYIEMVLRDAVIGKVRL